MRILLTILFVSFFVLAGNGQIQSFFYNYSKVKSTFFADSAEHNRVVSKKNGYVDQDSNETNDLVLFYIDVTGPVKPICREIKPAALFFHSLHQNHLNYLCIDLPPPANSFFV